MAINNGLGISCVPNLKYQNGSRDTGGQMADLFNEKEITLDKLREYFHNNDFSTLPVKDPSEYTEKQLKLYNRVLRIVNAEWRTISKSLGLTHPQDCYSKDYPPELIRDRTQRIIADNVVRLCSNKRTFWNMLWHFIVPMFLKRKNSDEALHNTTNALMQTLDIEGLSKSAKEFSCDEDFNPNKAINYPRMDHIKKWKHTRAKVKVESLDAISERSPDGEPPQIPDKTNVETAADIHILIENLINSASEQEREIIGLLSEGYNQTEIAKRLGISQSTVSRKVKKFKSFLSASV